MGKSRSPFWREHHGVVFKRLEDERAINKIEVLRQRLESYTEKLPEEFVAARKTRGRFGVT